MYCMSITYVKYLFPELWLAICKPITNQRQELISRPDMLACFNAAEERGHQQYVCSSEACDNCYRKVMAYYPYYPSRMRDFRVSSLLEGCSQFIPGMPGSSSSIPNNLNSNSYMYPPYHPQQLTKQASHFGPAAMAAPHSSSPQVHMPSHDSDLDSADMSLENKDLWMKFYNEKTEMVITKAGR